MTDLKQAIAKAHLFTVDDIIRMQDIQAANPMDSITLKEAEYSLFWHIFWQALYTTRKAQLVEYEGWALVFEDGFKSVEDIKPLKLDYTLDEYKEIVKTLVKNGIGLPIMSEQALNMCEVSLDKAEASSAVFMYDNSMLKAEGKKYAKLRQQRNSIEQEIAEGKISVEYYEPGKLTIQSIKDILEMEKSWSKSVLERKNKKYYFSNLNRYLMKDPERFICISMLILRDNRTNNIMGYQMIEKSFFNSFNYISGKPNYEYTSDYKYLSQYIQHTAIKKAVEYYGTDIEKLTFNSGHESITGKAKSDAVLHFKESIANNEKVLLYHITPTKITNKRSIF